MIAPLLVSLSCVTPCPKMLKAARKVRANQYGNLIAYTGRYRVFDFGLDEMSAKEWVALGCYCTFASHTGWRSITTDGCSIDCPKPDVTIEKLDTIRHTRF